MGLYRVFLPLASGLLFLLAKQQEVFSLAPLTRQLVLSLGCATFWSEYGYHPHTPAAPRELMPVGPRLLMQLTTISSDRSLSATCDALGRGRSLRAMKV